MSRITCYRCFWPKHLCWCGSLVPMATRTRFVLLMHPKEYKQEKAATGRLTHLCLSNSEIQMGIGFDEHARVQKLIRDPGRRCVLLYPGREALNLSNATDETGQLATLREQLTTRELVVFVLDATWSLGRKMLKLSPSLQRLPRVMFTPSTPSRYVIKQQPAEGCLSTLEAVHELLAALDRAGLDTYPDPTQLLAVFDRMQQFQIACATDPSRPGYRRSGYRAPGVRKAYRGQSARRRAGLFRAPA
jgi:DTW domain-containing protein YfiP